MKLTRMAVYRPVVALTVTLALTLFGIMSYFSMGLEQNPQRNLPIGILGGLAICTALYVIVGAVLTGMVPYRELAVADLWATGVAPDGHPTKFVRPQLDAMGAVPADRLLSCENGSRVIVGGVVTHRQRPATAQGTTMSLRLCTRDRACATLASRLGSTVRKPTVGISRSKSARASRVPHCAWNSASV